MVKKVLLFGMICSVLACEETIFEPDISGETVQLLAPTDGSVVTTEAVQFNWDEIDGASDYRLQVATPNFTNASQVIVDTTVTSLSFLERVTSGNYQWRVRAQNSGHQTSYSLATFSVE